MRNISLAEAQKALQAIMNQKGAKLFEKAKAAYLEDVLVVNDDGTPVEDLAFEVKSVDKAETKSATEAIDIDAAVNSAVTKAFASIETKATARPIEEKRSAPYIKRFGGYKVKSFDGSRDESEEKAARFGYWFAAVAGQPWGLRGCKSMGIDLIRSGETKAHTEGVNTAGGYLVDPQAAPDLIRLVEQYGVFRRNARVRPMTSDELQIKRRTAGLTGYWTGEAVATTESTMAFDRVILTASKLTALTTASIELVEDAAVSIGDLVAEEIALTFAQKEDDAAFNGTGTSTYGGYTGICQRLIDINTDSDGGGFEAVTSWSGAVIADIDKLMSLTQNVQGFSPKFYCSQAFYGQVLHRLAAAVNGTGFIERSKNGWQYMFAGVPVEIVNVMSVTNTSGTVPLLYGDMSLSSSFGDRMQMEIATNVGALNTFEQGEIAIRGIERVAINNHDLGTSTLGGPLVGLYIT